MVRFLQLVTLGLAALLPIACISQQKGGQVQSAGKRVAPPMYLGAVHQVYPKMGCALLRIIGPMPSAGSTLISHPPDGSNVRIANLCVTSDSPSSRGFIMADIRSGSVLAGDRVFVYRDLTPIAAKEDEEDTADRLSELISDLPSNTEVPENKDGEAEHPELKSSGGVVSTPSEDEGEDDTTVEVTPAPASEEILDNGPGHRDSNLDHIPDTIDGWN